VEIQFDDYPLRAGGPTDVRSMARARIIAQFCCSKVGCRARVALDIFRDAARRESGRGNSKFNRLFGWEFVLS